MTSVKGGLFVLLMLAFQVTTDLIACMRVIDGEPIDWQAPFHAPETEQNGRLRREITAALLELAAGKEPKSVLGMLAVSKTPLSLGELSAMAEVVPSSQREGLGSLVCAGLVYQDENGRSQIHPALKPGASPSS